MANSYWETETGNYKLVTVTSVSVGEPTKASWANDMKERDKFFQYSRAPYVGVTPEDGGGGSKEVGNDTGIILDVVSYVGPDSYLRITKSTDDWIGMPMQGDGFTKRMFTVYCNPYLAGTTLSGAKTHMPGGSNDSWLDSYEATPGDGTPLQHFWSGSGVADLSSGHRTKWIIETSPSTKYLGLFVSDGSTLGGQSTNQGEIIVYSGHATQYTAFHMVINAGPKWISTV